MSCTTCSGDEMKNPNYQWLKIQWKLKMPLAPEEQSICRKKQDHNKLALKMNISAYWNYSLFLLKSNTYSNFIINPWGDGLPLWGNIHFICFYK